MIDFIFDPILNFLSSKSPIMQALFAGLFTWVLTALGAALVFFFKSTNRKFLDTALGFTGGVMIAASVWSLIAPAINAVEVQNELGQSSLPPFLPAAIGFFLGAVFMYVLDKSIPHLHIFGKMKEAEGPKTELKKTSLLVLAIAIHNIPEGLAVGVAFGSLVIPEFANIYTLGLFGPSKEINYRPWGSKSYFLRTESNYEELVKVEGYSRHHSGSLMTTLTVDKVLRKCHEILNQ